MASTLPNLQGPALKTSFPARSIRHLQRPSSLPGHHPPSSLSLKLSAKFNLMEQLLGGRGGRLCNGEKGVQVELKRNFDDESPPSRTHVIDEDSLASAASGASSVPEDAFEKEMMGLTGGFPGREKGQKLFIEKNPPPPKKAAISMIIPSSKPKPPELPLLMPGMIAIAKNPNNPFYMYWGIVQRIPAR